MEEKEERETEEAKDEKQPQEWSEREKETHMGMGAERRENVGSVVLGGMGWRGVGDV